MSETTSALEAAVGDAVDAMFEAGHYPRAWAAWAIGVAASFAVLEASALRSTPGPKTLSAQLRRARRVNAALIAGGAAWLVWHIGWDGHPTTSRPEGKSP